MILEDHFTIQAPQSAVWQFLNDIPKVSQCVPGVEKVEELSPNVYQGILRVKVGPVSAAFTGKVSILERENNKFVAKVEGKDNSTASNVSATFSALVAPVSEGTSISYQVDFLLRGRMAQYGQAVIQGTARKMTDDFALTMQDILSPTQRIVVWGMDFPNLEQESAILAGLDYSLDQVESSPNEIGWKQLARAHILLVGPQIDLNSDALRQLSHCKMLVCYAREAAQVDPLRIATQLGIRITSLGDFDAAERAERLLDLIKKSEYLTGKWILGCLGWDPAVPILASRLQERGVTLLAHDPAGSDEAKNTSSIQLVTQEELLRSSDLISLHGRMTPHTVQMINTRALAQMKPEVLIMNTSHPGLVDTAALEQAVREGLLYHPIVESFSYKIPELERNQLQGDKPEHPAVVSHVSAASLENMRRLAAEQAARFIRNEKLLNLANPEVEAPREKANDNPNQSLHWSD